MEINLTSNKRPTLKTKNLKLRPSSLDDVEAISEILSNRAIVDTAMHIPHPFEMETAREWISKHQERYEEGVSVDFYIDHLETKRLIGVLHIDIDAEQKHAEFGFYIAEPFWGRGYASEAVTSALKYSFKHLAIERVFAWCLCRNEPS